MPVIVDILLIVVPILIPIIRTILPKLMPKLLSAFGKAGLFALILSKVSSIWGWFRAFPKFFVSLFEVGGKLYKFRVIAYGIRMILKSPIVLVLGLVLSSLFPGVVEKIFLVIGAVSLKLAIKMMMWGKSILDDADESNSIEELRDVLGDSADLLPSCMVDILGYLHLIEDLGMIITTIAFVGIYNLIKRLYFKWI